MIENLEKNDIEKFEKLILGRLASGQVVYDKPESHLHYNVRDYVKNFLSEISATGEEFVTKEFTVDEDIPYFLTQIDLEKDELFLAQRKGRKGYSLFVKNKAPATINNILITLRRSDSYPDTSITPVRDGYTLATAYAGTNSPREPWDPWFDQGITPEDSASRFLERNRAIDFWSKHALIPDEKEFPIVDETERSFKKEVYERINYV